MQFSTAISLAIAAVAVNAFDPSNLPAKTDSSHGQFGYNDCIKRYGASNAKAHCQNVYVNSVQDFCLWAPHQPDVVGNAEARTISYCTKSGHGTRVMPKGTIKGAHFLKTPSYVQVTGKGDFTKINIKKGDEGGELDPHGADGSGNPVGGIVTSKAFTGKYQQVFEWQNFMSASEFCIRACNPAGQNAKEWCPHIYDVMGCYWNEPANYDKGVFEDCVGTEGEWPGVYRGSTWYQGNQPTPKAQTAGKSSDCTKYATVTGGAIKGGNARLASKPTPNVLAQIANGVENTVEKLL